MIRRDYGKHLFSFWLGFFLFSVYLLSFSGKLHVMDELAVFAAGNNLAQYGRADINQLIWTHHWTPNPPGVWGSDGNLYTKKAPGISFITAPLIWLGHTMPGLNAVHVGLLTNALATALTAALLFVWLVDLGFSRSIASLTGLGYGLYTFAWVYARMFWAFSLLALCFLAGVWAMRRATDPTHIRHRTVWILLGGVAMAFGLTLRFEAVVAIVLLGLYLLAKWAEATEGCTQINKSTNQQIGEAARHALRFTAWGRALTIYLAPSLLAGLGLLYFNFVRYGSFGETGYSQEILFREPWVGTFGLLFSPGVGLFIYAPLMWLLFLGLRPAWRRLSRLYFWLIALLCLFYCLFYGSWFAWGGTWGWGPRFLLPILPLLMLFVAEPLEWLYRCQESKLKSGLLWLGVETLIILSIIVNFLGIVVDFNEHFLRLDSNDDFVFNWVHFPPLAHWHILQEGLVDLIWLRRQSGGLVIEWPVLIPPLLLFILAVIGLAMVGQGQKRFIVPYSVLIIPLAIVLIYQMMVGTARLALADTQTQADLPLLETLTTAAQPGDVLLIPMPPFGDVQEITTRLMAYLDRPLPTYTWIESELRAIRPDERERMWPAALAGSGRVWLFERWLVPAHPSGPTAARLNQDAFPIREQWFARSGKLTLYALPGESQPVSSLPLDVSFQGGLTLVDFAVLGEIGPRGPVIGPGETLKLRLTWRAAEVGQNPEPGMSKGRIIVFVQLLSEAAPGQKVNGIKLSPPGPPEGGERNEIPPSGGLGGAESATNLTALGRKVAQNERLLVDQNFGQSPLLPGQMVQQGYGLALPEGLAAGPYSLVVGLHHATTGQHLSRTDGSPDESVRLTVVEVR